MDLQLAALTLAAHLQTDSDQLLAYAREGLALNIGGYHVNASERQWDSGAVWAVEGALLYALIRQFRFSAVAEIGGYWGCSATWMAAAIRANEGGIVYSVDSGALGAQHGAKIPADLRDYVILIAGDGEDWLKKQADQSLQLVFEDADHGTETSRRLALAALPKVVNGGLYVVHDAAHDHAFLGDGNIVNVEEGKAIRAGLDAAALPYRVYLVEPSDCGFAVVKVQHAEVDASPVVEPVLEVGPLITVQELGEIVRAGQEWYKDTHPEIEPTPAPKKTRKPRTPKAKK